MSDELKDVRGGIARDPECCAFCDEKTELRPVGPEANMICGDCYSEHITSRAEFKQMYPHGRDCCSECGKEKSALRKNQRDLFCSGACAAKSVDKYLKSVRDQQYDNGLDDTFMADCIADAEKEEQEQKPLDLLQPESQDDLDRLEDMEDELMRDLDNQQWERKKENHPHA